MTETPVDAVDLSSTVHLVGEFPGKDFAGALSTESGSPFELLYTPTQVTDGSEVWMTGAAPLFMTMFPPGSVLEAPGRPPVTVDYADPGSIWAVFAYNGAAFGTIRGVTTFPEVSSMEAEGKIAT